MTDRARTIECPKCHHEFDINEALYQQVSEDLEEQLRDQLDAERKKVHEAEASLKAQQEQLDREKANQQKRVEEAISAKLKTEREALRKQFKAAAEEEQADRLKAMQEELESKSEKLKQLNEAQIENERLRREMSEVEGKAKLKMEKRLTALVAEERERLSREAEEESELKIKEKDLLISQMKMQLADMKRRAEQGSMQVQGEAKELVIEEWLAQAYPLDTIEEIKKGAQGADCIQIVNTRSASRCGEIYYESKRTKAFSAKWIEKFKKDIRERGANIGVLVTEAMPAGMDQMGQVDGVWVCGFHEFKSLSNVLRESLIAIHRVGRQQENKGDKMSLLYDFLTSDEFRMQVEGIVEGFTQMRDELEREKRAMQRIWKEREKQIDKVLHNTSNMYGSIRGIAGNAIGSVRYLELPGADLDEDEQE